MPTPKYIPKQPHPAMPGTIFVSIANYRDNETPRTLRDIYANAAQPERVFVGVFSQVVPGEDDDCLPADGFPEHQVRQLFIHADEGLGACWARSRILTELYGGEDFILQIDSHSRFVQGWDNGFIAMLGKCASARPILTTYPAGYFPPEQRFGEPHTPILAGLEFNQHGILLVKGIITDAFEFPPSPKPSAFLSGNCLFGPAAAFQQVPYDPYLYFHGEEISYAVRMWTHGWDLFAPNDVLMYTDYVAGRGRRRHWDDQQRWAELNTKSFQRLRHLFRLENITDPAIIRDFEHYDLGTVRSLAQYEAFADVSFATHYFGPRALEARFPLPGEYLAAKDKLPTIFVSIASYRDSETAATLRDLFARASFPERIFVGVCTQIVPETDAHCLPDAHPHVRELRVHAAQSRGVCWARYHILDQLLKDEDYVLQIDSHSRFSQGWDERFVNLYLDCPSPYTVLSASPAAYAPDNDVLQSYYSICTAEKFNDQGVLAISYRAIHLSDKPPTPLPAAFICGGQLFGPAHAFKQVPPDPYLYFQGEEIAYSARLWTHGWDIVAPNDALVYHEYSQNRGRPCHWHDHPEWDFLNQRAFARVRHLLGTQASQDTGVLREIERFGLGEKRSLSAYEHYADVSFAQRTAGQRALDGRFLLEENGSTRVDSSESDSSESIDQIINKLQSIAESSPTSAIDEALRLQVWTPGTPWHHQEVLACCAEIAADISEYALAGLAAYQAQHLSLRRNDDQHPWGLPDLPGIKTAHRVYNLVRHIPLRTKHLQFHRPGLEDQDFLLHMFKDAEFAKKYSRPAIGKEESRVYHLIKNDQRIPSSESSWAWVISDLSGNPLGLLELNQINFFQRSADMSLGFYSQQASSLATEAFLTGMRVAFHHLNLERITSHIYTDNLRSLKIHDRLGYVHEYTMEDSSYAEEQQIPVSLAVYSLLRDDALKEKRLEQAMRVFFAESSQDLLLNQMDTLSAHIVAQGPRWRIFPPPVLPDIPPPPTLDDDKKEWLPPPTHVEGMRVRLRLVEEKDRDTFSRWLASADFTHSVLDSIDQPEITDALVGRLGNEPGKIVLWVVVEMASTRPIGFVGAEIRNQQPTLFATVGFERQAPLRCVLEAWHLLHSTLCTHYPNSRLYLMLPRELLIKSASPSPLMGEAWPVLSWPKEGEDGKSITYPSPLPSPTRGEGVNQRFPRSITWLPLLTRHGFELKGIKRHFYLSSHVVSDLAVFELARRKKNLPFNGGGLACPELVEGGRG